MGEQASVKLLVGGDPEIFLKDTKKGMHVSAHDLVPGTKKDPHKVKKGAVQHDGLALEINIDPAETAAEFKENLSTVLEEARQILPSHIQMDFSPVVDFDCKYFNSLPSTVKELGCDPDFAGRTGARNRMPSRKRIGDTACTGAGHITLGWREGGSALDPDHFWDCQQMARRLDLYFQHYRMLWDIDDRRSQLYGAGAAFRPKPFGVEYRALSNAWLGKPEIWSWIFDSTKFVFEHAVQGKKVDFTYLTRYAAPRPFAYKRIGFNSTGHYVRQFKIPADGRIVLLNPEVMTAFGVKEIPKIPDDFKPVEYPIEEIIRPSTSDYCFAPSPDNNIWGR